MELSNINKINTNLGLDNSKKVNNVNLNNKEEIKLESKITKDGVLLKYANQEKLVKIEGDVNNIKEGLEYGGDLFGVGLLFGIISSAFEGALKGLGVVMLNGIYPLVPTISKYIDSYKKVKEEAEDLGVKNDNEIKKAALKGGLLGSVKGLLHGVLDLAVIGSLTALGVGMLGPVGFVLAPFIGTVYNIAKDDIRRNLSKETTEENNTKENDFKKEKKNKEIDNYTAKLEKNLYFTINEEPFLPFPPEKPANPINRPSKF